MRKIILILIIKFFFSSFALSENIKIITISNDKENFEKMEMLFGDYRIYTNRAGGIKIRRISDNKQLVVFSDNFKIKFYNDGDQIFDFIFNEKKESISIKYRDIELFTWEGKYFSKHKAYFFQVLAYDKQPFHYYINLQAKPSSALNMEKFELKIAEAARKGKIQIAAKYNITPKLIELILNKKKITTNKKIDKFVLDEKKLDKEVEDLIGKERAKEFDLTFLDEVESKITSIVDKAIEDAISDGVLQANTEANFIEILTRMQTKR